jgi:hypothetical protein
MTKSSPASSIAARKAAAGLLVTMLLQADLHAQGVGRVAGRVQDLAGNPLDLRGIFTSFVLEHVVDPAIHEIWKGDFEMKRARAESQAAALALLPSPDAAQ